MRLLAFALRYAGRYWPWMVAAVGATALYAGAPAGPATGASRPDQTT